MHEIRNEIGYSQMSIFQTSLGCKPPNAYMFLVFIDVCREYTKDVITCKTNYERRTVTLKCVTHLSLLAVLVGFSGPQLLAERLVVAAQQLQFRERRLRLGGLSGSAVRGRRWTLRCQQMVNRNIRIESDRRLFTDIHVFIFL